MFARTSPPTDKGVNKILNFFTQLFCISPLRGKMEKLKSPAETHCSYKSDEQQLAMWLSVCMRGHLGTTQDWGKEGGRGWGVGGLSKCPHHYCSLIVEVEQRGPNYLKGISVALTPNNKWFRDFPLQPRFVSLTKSSAQHESLMRTTTTSACKQRYWNTNFQQKPLGASMRKEFSIKPWLWICAP